MAEITLVDAVNLALARAMEEDPAVLVYGEDVGVNGGVFRATAGLQQRFGSERVLDTPLADVIDEIRDRAASGEGPIAVVEPSDNIGGGAPGDSTSLS